MPVYVAARRLRVLYCQHQCGARRSGARSAERVFPRRSHLRHQHSRRSGHALRSSGAHCYCWAPRVTQLCTRARSARARARAPSPRAEAVVTRRPTCCDLCAEARLSATSDSQPPRQGFARRREDSASRQQHRMRMRKASGNPKRSTTLFGATSATRVALGGERRRAPKAPTCRPPRRRGSTWHSFQGFQSLGGEAADQGLVQSQRGHL